MNWLDTLSQPLEYQFMRTAALATILIGTTCALLGTYVVLRQISFIGDAIAHTSLPGIAIAYLLGVSLFGGAITAALLTAYLISWISRAREIREDTAIGISFTAMFAVGIAIIGLAPNSYRDLSHVLFGNVLGVTSTDLALICGASVVAMIGLALFHKELELTSYDPTHARAIGINPDRVRTILLTLLALAVVTGIQAVGIVLTTALLITPAATAALLTRRLPKMMLIAALLGTLGSLAGLYLSYFTRIAAGALMVLCCTAIFVIVSVLKRLRTPR